MTVMRICMKSLLKYTFCRGERQSFRSNIISKIEREYEIKFYSVLHPLLLT